MIVLDARYDRLLLTFFPLLNPRVLVLRCIHLILGKDHKSAIGTIVERQARYVLLVNLKSKDATSVRKAFAKKLKEIPVSLTKTMTYDRGKEISEHANFTIATGIKVFFCDPQSSWQRGTCENTNGLIRNFFPKGTDFGAMDQKKLQWVREALIERLRLDPQI